MSKITIWHNPKCSKSREALSLVEENGTENEIVKYLESKPTVQELKDVLKMLDITARELMRTKEDIYKELDLKSVMDEEELINAMAQNPKLIERPILIKNGKAIIGRPTEIIADFLRD
jgi:arsenate reductase